MTIWYIYILLYLYLPLLLAPPAVPRVAAVAAPVGAGVAAAAGPGAGGEGAGDRGHVLVTHHLDVVPAPTSLVQLVSAEPGDGLGAFLLHRRRVLADRECVGNLLLALKIPLIFVAFFRAAVFA